MTRYEEIQQLFSDWTKRTESALKKQVRLKKIEGNDLLNSVAANVAREQGFMLSAQVSFLTHGRFVDMGKGRPRNIQTQENAREVMKGGRKPKKWYSRTIYGRIHLLSTLMAVKVAEVAVKNLAEELRKP